MGRNFGSCQPTAARKRTFYPKLKENECTYGRE